MSSGAATASPCQDVGREIEGQSGHTPIDTTQVYATIRPAQLKRAVSFYEERAARMLSTRTTVQILLARVFEPGFHTRRGL